MKEPMTTEAKNRIRNLLNLEWLELDARRMQALPGSKEEADLTAQQQQVEEEMQAL